MQNLNILDALIAKQRSSTLDLDTRTRRSISAARKVIARDILDDKYVEYYEIMTLESSDPIEAVIKIVSKYFDRKHLAIHEAAPLTIVYHRPAIIVNPDASENTRRIRAKIEAVSKEISRDILDDTIKGCYSLWILRSDDPITKILKMFAKNLVAGEIDLSGSSELVYYPQGLWSH